MIYTKEQLRQIIQPIIATAVKMDEDPNTKIEAATNAILTIIEQDRQAHD